MCSGIDNNWMILSFSGRPRGKIKTHPHPQPQRKPDNI